MSSGGSSHPDPPPGFTVTSGAKRTLGIQYEAIKRANRSWGAFPWGNKSSMGKLAGPFRWLR